MQWLEKKKQRRAKKKYERRKNKKREMHLKCNDSITTPILMNVLSLNTVCFNIYNLLLNNDVIGLDNFIKAFPIFRKTITSVKSYNNTLYEQLNSRKEYLLPIVKATNKCIGKYIICQCENREYGCKSKITYISVLPKLSYEVLRKQLKHRLYADVIENIEFYIKNFPINVLIDLFPEAIDYMSDLNKQIIENAWFNDTPAICNIIYDWKVYPITRSKLKIFFENNKEFLCDLFEKSLYLNCVIETIPHSCLTDTKKQTLSEKYFNLDPLNFYQINKAFQTLKMFEICYNMIIENINDFNYLHSLLDQHCDNKNIKQYEKNNNVKYFKLLSKTVKNCSPDILRNFNFSKKILRLLILSRYLQLSCVKPELITQELCNDYVDAYIYTANNPLKNNSNNFNFNSIPKKYHTKNILLQARFMF